MVNGDVDNSTGNINFNGDLNIMGNVTAGFSVTATGSVALMAAAKDVRSMPEKISSSERDARDRERQKSVRQVLWLAASLNLPRSWQEKM